MITNSIKGKLAVWMYRKSKSAIKDIHLSIHHNDIKCPNCKEWFSISGLDHKHKDDYDKEKGIYICECGKCGNVSFWNPNIFPFLCLCDDKGIPLTAEGKDKS